MIVKRKKRHGMVLIKKIDLFLLLVSLIAVSVYANDTFKGTRAGKLYKKACDGGSANGCNNLGFIYDAGKGITKNPFIAVKFYKKACAMGDIDGCYNLGNMYKSGRGVRKNPFIAVKLYKKACDGGSAYGCLDLGFNYENGKGVKQNNFKAAKFFKKACAMGLDDFGCINYSRLKNKLGE